MTGTESFLTRTMQKIIYEKIIYGSRKFTYFALFYIETQKFPNFEISTFFIKQKQKKNLHKLQIFVFDF